MLLTRGADVSSELQGAVLSNEFGVSLVLILTVITSCVYLYRSMPKTGPIKHLCTSSVRSAHPVGFSTHRYSDRRTLNATLIQFIIPKIRRYLKHLHHPDKIRHVFRNFRFLISFDLVSNGQIALCVKTWTVLPWPWWRYGIDIGQRRQVRQVSYPYSSIPLPGLEQQVPRRGWIPAIELVRTSL